jgi:hypothetical protein
LPYPQDVQQIPVGALEYPGEAGRHSGTYAAAGLERGQPALRLTVSNRSELDDAIEYIRATSARRRGGIEVVHEQVSTPNLVETSLMSPAQPLKPRREAIPRLVQREVWQRDGGQCVECSTRERLCFDHIVPFSKGGSNSVRNLQLLCERCNSSKSNRI